jgi:hypothetical protein
VEGVEYVMDVAPEITGEVAEQVPALAGENHWYEYGGVPPLAVLVSKVV